MDRSEIDSLKADLRRMQSRVDELESTAEEPTNRRNMLRGLGAAAAGAAVGGLAFARPVAAGHDSESGLLKNNQIQTSTSPTSLIPTTGFDSSDDLLHGAFTVTNDSAFTSINAALSCIAAYADSSKPSGHTIGLLASSKAGVGAKLDGPVPLKLTDNTSSGAPSQSSGSIGQFKVNNGDLWFCVDDDSSHNWRKLAGLATAGAFHALTPFRAYDSRAANPIGNVGILTRGLSRTVSIKDTRDGSGVITQNNTVPVGATAVTANVTITSTTAPFGFLAVNPGGNTSDASSAINWSGANQTIANGLTLTLNSNRELEVVCGGGVGGDTHFIIDISGYYL